MRGSFFAASILGLVVMAHNAAAETKGGAVPEWLRGEWIVSKVYEHGGVYPDPPAEPKIWYPARILTVEADRLSLGDDVCAEATTREASATFRRFLLDSLAGSKLRSLGVPDRRGQVKYLEMTCGRSFINDASGLSERYIGRPLKWEVIRKDDDTIEMPFFGGCFLVLHRQKPTS